MAVEDLFSNIAFQVTEPILVQVMSQVQKQIESEFGKFTKAMEGSIISGLRTKDGLERSHRAAAKKGQERVLKRYEEVVEAKKKIPESYRVGLNRFSGGALRRALASEAMLKVDARGISFGDKTKLDREAAHWYRLNYGAGMTQVRPTKVFRIWEETVGIKTARPASPAFHMPYGKWGNLSYNVGLPGGGSIKAAGGYGFYPRRRPGQPQFRPEESQIFGRYYLDGFVEGVGANLPAYYEGLVNRMAKRAIEKAKNG